jgi:hypothetical protein
VTQRESTESIARKLCTYGFCATCKDAKKEMCEGGRSIAEALQTERDSEPEKPVEPAQQSVASLPDCGSCDCVFVGRPAPRSETAA